MNPETYENFKKRSLEGTKSSSKKEKVQIDRAQFRKKVKYLILISAVVGGVLTSGATKIKNYLEEQATISSYIHECRDDMVMNHIHRTSDYANYFYDYASIANEMKKKEVSGKNIYSLYILLGEDGIENVIRMLGENSFQDYLEKNGYSDIDDWKNDQRRTILLDSQISEKQEELQEMNLEHITIPANQTDGKGVK